MQFSLVYTFLQGIVVGALSCYVQFIFPWVIFLSFVLSAGACTLCWSLYHIYNVRLSSKQISSINAMVGFISIFYLISFVLEFFWNIQIPWVYDNTMTGVIFSLSVSTLAWLNSYIVLQDIDLFEKRGGPEYLSWFFATELLAAIIWGYVEFVILLFKWLMSKFAWTTS